MAQFPIADARPFVRNVTHKLDRPRFGVAFDFERMEFLRSYGSFAEREPGLPSDWPAEDVFCHAARGIGLQTEALRQIKTAIGGPGQFVGAFRRFLSNGEAVARVEIGLSHSPSSATLPTLGADTIKDLLVALAELEIQARTRAGALTPTLATAGRVLAAQILASSTQWSSVPAGFATPGWWVSPGRPLFIVEYRQSDVTSLPPDARVVSTADPNTTLHHIGLGPSHGNCRAWLVGLGQNIERKNLRALRLHLSRLHSEREVARLIMRHIADGYLEVPDGIQRDDPLVLYLEQTLGFLSREKVYGHSQSDFLRTAYGFEDLVTGTQRATLRNELSKTYKALAASADAVTTPNVRGNEKFLL